MGHVVEVPVADENLHDQMNRMRGWLDHRRFEPSSFRLSQVSDRQVVRVAFKSESEAVAFASVFGGSLIAPSVPDVAIA